MAFGSAGKLGPIGIDFSDNTLEAVQLSGASIKQVHVAGWAQAVIPPGAMKQGRVAKGEVIRELLRQMFSKPSFGSLEGRRVILSMPEHQCYHQVLSFPLWGAQGTAFSLTQEALSKEVPFALEDMYWDWQTTRDDTRQQYVFAVAVQKEVIDGYQELFKNLGMTIEAVEPQVLSSTRALWRDFFREEPVLFVDIGAQETTLATIDDLGVHQSSIVGTGAEIWAQEIAQKLQANLDVTKKVVQTLGLRQVNHPKADMIHQVLMAGADQVVREARQHLTYYGIQPHVQSNVIKQFVAVGGGALIPGLVEYLAQNLKLSAQPAAAWFGVKPPLNLSQTMILSNALGAAVRGLGFSLEPPDPINVLETRRGVVEQTTSSIGKLGGLIGKWLKPKPKKAPASPEAAAAPQAEPSASPQQQNP